jgi:hypothetical protein
MTSQKLLRSRLDMCYPFSSVFAKVAFSMRRYISNYRQIISTSLSAFILQVAAGDGIAVPKNRSPRNRGVVR